MITLQHITHVRVLDNYVQPYLTFAKSKTQVKDQNQRLITILHQLQYY
jgi:hypothetical protein